MIISPYNTFNTDICPKCKNINTIRMIKFKHTEEGEHISTTFECSKCKYKFRVKVKDDKLINNEHSKTINLE